MSPEQDHSGEQGQTGEVKMGLTPDEVAAVTAEAATAVVPAPVDAIVAPADAPKIIDASDVPKPAAETAAPEAAAPAMITEMGTAPDPSFDSEAHSAQMRADTAKGIAENTAHQAALDKSARQGGGSADGYGPAVGHRDERAGGAYGVQGLGEKPAAPAEAAPAPAPVQAEATNVNAQPDRRSLRDRLLGLIGR